MKKKEPKENNVTSSNKNKKSSQMNSKEINNARIGYQAAINLWIYENESIWSKFNAFLVANSIIFLAAIGIMIQNSTSCLLWVFLVTISIMGMFFCVLWVLMAKRSFDYVKYWTSSAREIEEKFLSPVKTVSHGKEFAEGKEVKFFYDTKPEPFHMSLIGRLLQIRKVLYIAITTFFVIYCMLFAYSLCRVIHCYCCCFLFLSLL